MTRKTRRRAAARARARSPWQEFRQRKGHEWDGIARMALGALFRRPAPEAEAIDVEHRAVEANPYLMPETAASLRENYSEPPEWRREYMGKWVEPPPEPPRSGESFTLRPRGPKFRAGMNVTIIDEQGAMEATVVADVGGKPG